MQPCTRGEALRGDVVGFEAVRDAIKLQEIDVQVSLLASKLYWTHFQPFCSGEVVQILDSRDNSREL